MDGAYQVDKSATHLSLTKRHVFYVMGFDPRGPEYYYGMLRREARISRKRGFSPLEVGTLNEAWEHGLQCQCSVADAPQFQINYEFLSISDIIEPYFRASLAWRLGKGLQLFAIMLFSGFIRASLRHTSYFALFTLYPFAVITLIASGCMFAGWNIGTSMADGVIARLGSIAGGLAMFCVLAHWLRRHDHRFYVYYLLGDFVFSHAAVTNRHPVLPTRMQQFVRRIEEAIRAAAHDEEILIVGHSSGAILAIQLAATVSRRLNGGEVGKLSLLTLGSQSSLGFFPHTEAFAADVAYLAGTKGLTWRDIFAPQDVISSGQFDPVEKLVPNRGDRSSLSLHSARFKEALSPATYVRMRHSFFQLHMQYLKATETGKGFNFFSVIASPLRLYATPL